MSNRSRLQQLDLLRAVAVTLVIFTHVEGPGVTLPFVVRVLRRWGWSGVDLFFVLSGFLVSGLLFREYQRYGHVQLGRFFVRRGLKIYPAFYFLLLVSVLANVYAHLAPNLRPVSLVPLLTEAAFIQNYTVQLWGHTWSLAVEEHFYLLVGLCVFLRIRTNQGSKDIFRGIGKVFFTVAVVCLALRITRSIMYPGIRNQWLTHLRMDSLLFGVFLSYLYTFHNESTVAWLRARWKKVLAISLVLIAPALVTPIDNIYTQTLGFTSLYLGYGGVMMLLLISADKQLPRVLSAPLSVVASIGSYSYSIYLWHVAVMTWGPKLCRGILGDEPSVTIYLLFSLVTSVIVGIVMAMLVESPFLRLRDRIFPSRSSALAAGTETAPKA